MRIMDDSGEVKIKWEFSGLDGLGLGVNCNVGGLFGKLGEMLILGGSFWDFGYMMLLLNMGKIS